MMKQIPYGITDFSRIQKENYYYVDKTMFIDIGTHFREIKPHDEKLIVELRRMLTYV